MLAYQTYLIFYIDSFSADVFSLVSLPQYYKYELFIIFVINFGLSYLYEWIFIGWFNQYWNYKSSN